ncbi:MAG: DUF1146 family protein [Bacilli bacterium]
MNIQLIKLGLYIFTIPLSAYLLSCLNINKIFKKNKVFEAQVFFTVVSFSLAYLFTSFIMDFILFE